LFARIVGPHLSERVGVLTHVQMRHWSFHMLNPWLAITFQAARLGFEAQNAMALRLMRFVGDASNHGMIANQTAAPPDVQAAATKVVPASARRHEFVNKVRKKRVPTNKRRRSK
jgi:hypothetical protein